MTHPASVGELYFNHLLRQHLSALLQSKSKIKAIRDQRDETNEPIVAARLDDKPISPMNREISLPHAGAWIVDMSRRGTGMAATITDQFYMHIMTGGILIDQE